VTGDRHDYPRNQVTPVTGDRHEYPRYQVTVVTGDRHEYPRYQVTVVTGDRHEYPRYQVTLVTNNQRLPQTILLSKLFGSLLSILEIACGNTGPAYPNFTPRGSVSISVISFFPIDELDFSTGNGRTNMTNLEVIH